MAPLDFGQPSTRRAWIKRLLALKDEAEWNRMARELFAWQFRQVPSYRRLCVARGFTPKTFSTWLEIPAVPQQLFKRQDLYAHGNQRTDCVYETSGTTTGKPGRQFLWQDDIYRAVSNEGARRAGLLKGNLQLHFIVPSPKDAPRSSLSAMFGFWQRAQRLSGKCFWASKESFDFDGLREVLRTLIKQGRPVGLSGTAFSFVHFLDQGSTSVSWRLPQGSWLLETGGFKGRSREIPKAELYREMSRCFGVPDAAIWNEYGMSELSSQAYARGSSGLHFAPPWARVTICDPASRREVRVGRQGLVKWIDLANTDSVFALQTLDLAERTRSGFRLIGRLPRTEPRGCSLGAEDMAARTS
jgi:hypothetical protein